jgi:hypothetical protein
MVASEVALMFGTIAEVFASYPQDSLPFPPTKLYNEEWLVRLVLHWMSQHQGQGGRLAFAEGARWYSEAALPTAFPPQKRGDGLGETCTHPDGSIGHFDIGREGKTDLSLHTDAKQFVVVEAKMYSPLSPKVKNAPGYDQAARTVACIAEVLRIAGRSPADVDRLGFYVLAPEEQVTDQVFEQPMKCDSIRQRVEDRVDQFSGTKEEWYRKCFLPTLDHIKLGVLTWESVIEDIREVDSVDGEEVDRFYLQCKQFNQPVGG